jgi:hypothetical protein
MSAAMSNSSSRPAASSGGLARTRRSGAGEREGRRAGRVFRRTSIALSVDDETIGAMV